MMSIREHYPAGAPCWVHALQPDPPAALDFYGALLGWEYAGRLPAIDGGEGEYFVARIDGYAVAGIGSLPAPGAGGAVWSTAICVTSVDETIERATRAGGRLLLGPLDSPTGGRRALLADPTGAAFEIQEQWDHLVAQLTGRAGAWAMCSLHTPNAAVAQVFYETVFGWHAEPIAPGAPLVLFRLPGYDGGAAQQLPPDAVGVMTTTAPGPDGAGTPPHWNVNIQVDITDAIAARAADLGGTVLVAPVESPGFRSAVVMDPQGAVFSVSQPTVSASAPFAEHGEGSR